MSQLDLFKQPPPGNPSAQRKPWQPMVIPESMMDRYWRWWYGGGAGQDASVKAAARRRGDGRLALRAEDEWSGGKER